MGEQRTPPQRFPQPIAGGSLVDGVGFEPVFALAAALAVLAFAVTFGLSAVRREE